MRLLINGLGKYSDTLHIKRSETFRLEEVSGVLNVEGTEYFYIQSGTLGVRYNGLDTPEHIAAQCLRVAAGGEEIELVVASMLPNEDCSRIALAIAGELDRITEGPLPIPIHRLVMRGTQPTYYRR